MPSLGLTKFQNKTWEVLSTCNIQGGLSLGVLFVYHSTVKIMCKKDLIYHLSVIIFHILKCIQLCCVIMLEKHGHCVGETSTSC